MGYLTSEELWTLFVGDTDHLLFESLNDGSSNFYYLAYVEIMLYERNIQLPTPRSKILIEFTNHVKCGVPKFSCMRF